MAKTLVLGLGNPLLGDDGVGWRVAQQVGAQFIAPDAEVEVDCFSRGGLSLMERLVGYERVILIDAIMTGEGPLGRVHCLYLEDLPDLAAGHTTSAHDTSLRTALRLGRTMGVSLPEEVIVVGVEAQSVYDFAEELSPPIAAAVAPAVKTVLALLQSWDVGADALGQPSELPRQEHIQEEAT